jgi:uridine phosphorylase
MGKKIRLFLFYRAEKRINMDGSAITTMIGSLGFPIVACLAIGWQYTKQQAQNNETLQKMSEALNNNTLAITKLTERMDNEKEESK